MPDKYYNIDSQNTTTEWYSPAYMKTYTSLGYSSYVNQSFTKVRIEVPSALNLFSAVIPTYWSDSPSGRTKFATSRSFLLSNDAYVPSPPNDMSMKVFLNGLEIPYTMVTTMSFTVPSGLEDGNLWCTYVPTMVESVVGDQTDSMSGTGVIAEHIVPPIEIYLIQRIRMAINNMEQYFSIVPTRWIGGANNMVKTGAQNIIKTHTPIYMQHVEEAKKAIQKLEDHFDTITPIPLTRYRFTDVDYSSTYMIQYIEELMDAIHSLEIVILDPNYYGG